MILKDLVQKFSENPSYMDTGAPKLAKRFGVDLNLVYEAKDIVRKVQVDKFYADEKNADDVYNTLVQAKPSLEKPEIDNWDEQYKWVKVDGQSVFLKKKDPVDSYESEFENFINTLKPEIEWKYTPLEYTDEPELCLVLALFDIHIGREGTPTHTGQVINFNTQVSDIDQSINSLISRIQFTRLEKIVLPIGSDFFNVDGPNGTTKGTPQDNTRDLPSMYHIGLKILTDTIHYLTGFAPVEVIFVPGNHDKNISNYLAISLATIFQSNKRVTVDYTPISRKYIRYGITTIGFAHGELPLQKYADLLPYEAREDFAKSEYWEYLIGDKHHEEGYKKGVYREHFLKEDGVVVRRLSALTKTDRWTYDNGYTTSKRRAYGIIYDKYQGRCHEIIHQL